MIPFIRISAMLRNARLSFAAHNYLDAVTFGAQAVSLLGFDGLAQDLLATIKDVQNGDAREIAVDTMKVVADVFGMIFTGAAPITVGVAVADTIEFDIESLACKCDKLAVAPTTGVAVDGESSADTKAIDPQTILVIVQIAQQLMTWFLDRRAKKQAA